MRQRPAGDCPCALLMVDARPEVEELRYAAVDIACKHDAAVETDTSSPREAYAPYPRPTRGSYRERALPSVDG